jgi:hypothetical protein
MTWGTESADSRRPGARNGPERRWVNGTIARVARLDEQRVWIALDGAEHEVEQVARKNRRYAYDRAQKRLSRSGCTARNLPRSTGQSSRPDPGSEMPWQRTCATLYEEGFLHGVSTATGTRCTTFRCPGRWTVLHSPCTCESARHRPSSWLVLAKPSPQPAFSKRTSSPSLMMSDASLRSLGAAGPGLVGDDLQQSAVMPQGCNALDQ